MIQRSFNRVAGGVFGLIAVGHGLRLLFHWEAVIGGWAVPIALSWLALVLFGWLATTAFTRKS